MGTRREADRTGRGGRRHGQAQDPTSDCDRPVPVQAGRGRIPRQAAAAPLRPGRGVGEDDHADVGGLRRALARLVARRQVARLREQAASRRRSRQQLGPVRDGRRARGKRRATSAHDVRGPGQRSRDREPTGVEPRRPVDRVPPGRPAQAHLLRRSETRGHAHRRGRAPDPHGGARSQRREPRVVERRVVHLLPARRRPHGRARARAGGGGSDRAPRIGPSGRERVRGGSER